MTTRRAATVPLPSSATLEEVIEAEWSRAASVLTDEQFEQVAKRETWFEDNRLGFLTYLRSIIRRPSILEHRDDAVFTCRCRDEGMMMNDRNEAFPCPYCRPDQHELWRDGHFRREHHGCPKCTPKGQRTGRAAGASPREELREDRGEQEADTVTAELF